MKVKSLVNILNSDFYTGVPDSQLKPLCDYLINTKGLDGRRHIIAANEGNAVALAAGYHMATGKIPVVYMQNSGEGNIINPLASLMNEKVYAIPCIFIIGWRGEPGIHDEPQHIYQGEVTCKLLEDMGVDYFILGRETTEEEAKKAMDRFKKKLSVGSSVAFIIRKGTLVYDKVTVYKNNYSMLREKVIQHIVSASDGDLIVCTTGKSSRELFEIREQNKQGHEMDFLTVGSMGHASSVALGLALNLPDRRVWCIDGDGAALMHMGAIPVIAYYHPKNLVHILINNGAHETVGGQPTVMGDLEIWKIARDCGYPCSMSVDNYEALNKELSIIKAQRNLTFLEVKCSLGSRADLGRPTTTAIENKNVFMQYL